jgi:hypothetical protein
MADDKPNPLEDVRKGLGLLFRAAKTTLEQLPTEKFEDAVVSGAREVGRAIENVAQTVEQQVFRKPTPHDAKPDAPDAPVKSPPTADDTQRSAVGGPRVEIQDGEKAEKHDERKAP